MPLLDHPNVRAVMDEAQELIPNEMELDPTQQDIANRIKHILSIYPALNPSMLQVGMGTSFPPHFWKPILQKLIEAGHIVNNSKTLTGPTGRMQVYTILELTELGRRDL